MVTTNETPRRRKNSWLNALLTLVIAALVTTVAGTNGLVRALRNELDGVKRESVATTALSPAHPDFENYLFVGSDSRAGSDPSDPDYNNVGAEGDIGGQRSDTLMVMHYVKATGTVSLLSIPRDLWVYIGDGDEHSDSALGLQRPALCHQSTNQRTGLSIGEHERIGEVGKHPERRQTMAHLDFGDGTLEYADSLGNLVLTEAGGDAQCLDRAHLVSGVGLVAFHHSIAA